MIRCTWAESSPLEIEYHDTEWGVPVHDDRLLFEALTLGSAQAGLSWVTVLKKRAHYRKAFSGFNPAEVARYDDQKIEQLLQDPGIIRNRRKIESAVNNASMVLRVREEWGSLDSYIWQFVGGKTVHNAWVSVGQLPSQTDESRHMSQDMKQRGFKFVGPTICYAFMQAVGMVNDHVVGCFRYDAIRSGLGAAR